jgi:hypothetical protein
MSNQKLVQETLQSLNGFLPKMANACLIIANHLRSDNENEAMHHIKEYIEAVEWSINAINGIKFLGYPLDIETKSINEYLIEAKDGLEVNDPVIIADMFEYEFHQIIESWINEIHQFKGE